jgi:hypothetical protein
MSSENHVPRVLVVGAASPGGGGQGDPRPGGIGEALGGFAARPLPRVRHVQETSTSGTR